VQRITVNRCFGQIRHDRFHEQGVTDMVRISDGRMSGTSFGKVGLQVSPESAVRGPLSLVEDGDLIEPVVGRS
jgi:dihydroxy-acid dehydratase